MKLSKGKFACISYHGEGFARPSYEAYTVPQLLSPIHLWRQQHLHFCFCFKSRNILVHLKTFL